MSKDSVRRPKEYETMLYDMCQSEKRIFRSYKDALVFAACLGFVKNSKKGFDDASKDPIKMHIFDDDFDQPIMNCIGLSETSDPEILGDKLGAERVKIFEEYAAGGLDLIHARVYSSDKDWDFALLEIIKEYEVKQNKILDDITKYI